MRTTVWMGMLAGLAAVALSAPEAQATEVHQTGLAVRVTFAGPFRRARENRQEAYRYGHDRGLREGRREGRRDAYRGQRFDYRDERSYRDSDDGWEPEMGPRPAYREGFRDGFKKGYRSGYHDSFDGRRRLRPRRDRDDD